jgi:hypothetical protein
MIANIDLSGVDFIKENPGETPIRIDLRARMETANPRGKPELLWRLFTHSPTLCSGYGRERLVPGKSLFCTAQPRKLGVEEGTGLGGGFARRHPSWHGRGRRGHLGAAISLVAAVGSAATCSQEAKLLWGLIE